VIGAILIVLAIVIALPVGLLMTGGLASAILGWFLREDAEEAHAGSELIDLNR
jgi:hypothetical protein